MDHIVKNNNQDKRHRGSQRLKNLECPDRGKAQNGPPSGSVVVIVASKDRAQYQKIREILEQQEFDFVDGLLPNVPLPVERLLKPSAFVLQVAPDPADASDQIAFLRSQDPDVPILFAVEQNTEQMEINVRQMGIQYYMLLPGDAEELTVVINCLARA